MKKTKKTPGVEAPAGEVAPAEGGDGLDLLARGETVTVKEETLEETPVKLLVFLRAVAAREPIRAALQAVGYDRAEHRLGWEHLLACSGYVEPVAGDDEAADADASVAKAVAELDSRDERDLTRIQASLQHRAPKAGKALVGDLKAGKGVGALMFYQKLLPRLDKLRKGTLAGVAAGERGAVVALLEKRGFTAAYLDELRGLMAKAQQFGAVRPPRTPGEDAVAEEQALRAARAFYEEWSDIARQEIGRRDLLVQLGLARPKRRARPVEA